jgi:hypothetical protein
VTVATCSSCAPHNSHVSDITQLGAIVGLATSAVGLTDKATSTVASIKELFDGDKAPDSSEATRLLNALAVELTSANMMRLLRSRAGFHSMHLMSDVRLSVKFMLVEILDIVIQLAER